MEFLQWLTSSVRDKMVYFSLDEKQSEYHPFDNACIRGRYDWRSIPVVYKFQTKSNRPLRLLNLRIDNIGGRNIHVLANTNTPLPLEYILSLKDQDDTLMTCIDTSLECNKLILLMIRELDLDVDGYVAFNDQSEVALLISEANDIFESDIEMKVFNIVLTYWYSFGNDDIDMRKIYEDTPLYERLLFVDNETDEFCAGQWVYYDNYMMHLSDDIRLIYTSYIPVKNNWEEQIRNTIINDLLID